METAVALIFFARPSTLSRVFEVIRVVKPKKLFLIQDGPRNNNDLEKMLECRAIVENVDWDCDIYKNYSEINLGCGLRPYTGITWVFEHVDKAIILEDDCVPNPSFFNYCDTLLAMYEKDERISYISGLNHFEKWDFGGFSYGFVKNGAIWGWATWKRSWARYDYSVELINNPYLKRLLEANMINYREKIKVWENTNHLLKNKTNLNYWDIQWGFVKHSQNQLVIVPEVNLISNIGVGSESTHAKNDNKKHKKYSDFNNMPTYSINNELVHPPFVLCDTYYDKLLVKCNKKNRKRMLLRAAFRKVFK